MIRFDCHAHVYERIVPTGSPRYVPPRPAPLAAWQDHLATHGLAGGVLVQPSFFGTDNSELVGALSGLDRERFRGIAVVDPAIAEPDLVDLASAGIVGVRWNLVEGGALPDPSDPVMRGFFRRLNAAGFHLEVHLEGPRLADWIAPVAPRVDRLAVDHFGRPSAADPADDPWIARARALGPASGVFAKLSAPYRSAALPQHAAALADALGPDRLVWGSDWPFTRHEGRITYGDMVRAGTAAIAPADDAQAMDALYGIRADASV